MLTGISRAAYLVEDMNAAKEWYRKVLGREPLLDVPQAVIFMVGNSSLSLAPLNPGTPSGSRSIVYWEVEDVQAAIPALTALGAKPHMPAAEVFGKKRASVIDPFGNILGLTETPAAAKSATIGEEASGTAMVTASLRALSATDEREEIRGNDTLARIFLTEERRRPLTDKAFREWVMKNGIPAGLYEFLVARTAWLDSLVEDALAAKVPQLVFLGAGYDTRALRFREKLGNTRVFEADAPPTQARKRAILAKEGVKIPENLVFVPVHFEKEKLLDRLLSAGYNPALRSFFVWEGVIYYLTREAIDQTFAFVRDNSGPGSELAFDYQSRPGNRDFRGMDNPAIQAMRDQMPSEPFLFRMEKPEMEAFLRERGFGMKESLESSDMEARYLKLKDGSLAGRISNAMYFAVAEKL